MIDNILDFAAIEAGRMELNLTRIDLRATLAGIMRETSGKTAHQRLKLKVKCTRDAGAPIADARRIGEVLSDLVNNAIALTLPGGTVAIGARHDGIDVVLWVAYTNSSIAADQVEAVFGAFRHGERPEGRGSSVGPAPTKSIIELHGRRIGIDSGPG